MTGISKFLRLRLGAKTNIVIGLVQVAIGLYFTWALVKVVTFTEGTIPFAYIALVTALALFFLGVGFWRIYRGLHCERKNWVDDPLQRR